MSIIIAGQSCREVTDSIGQKWEIIEKTMPSGYRMVATVDRPDGTIHDLGQNAEGKFALFRRSDDPWTMNSHVAMDRLSDADLAGFGLLRAVCVEPETVQEWGDFSALCKSNLVT